jgi:predicted ATPase
VNTTPRGLHRFHVQGFRRLHDINLDLRKRPFLVLIGANGAGKTSFLDAFSLLAAAASGNMNDTLSRMGGVSSLLTRGKSRELSLYVEMPVPGYEPLRYDLHLMTQGTGYSISKESLSQVRPVGRDSPFMHIDSANGNTLYFDLEERRLVPAEQHAPISPNWNYNHLETALFQVPKMFRQPEELRSILASVTQYHVLDVGSRAPVKLPQTMKPAILPGADGEDLAPYLYYLRESDSGRYEMIIDSLRAAFPDFEDLNFPPVASGMLTITWRDRKFNNPIYMHELSEGTLRFLWLVSLLHSPNLSTVTMIDEPEVSLHPELLSLLADLMREASKRTQLVVATHSDSFVRFLKPEELIVMDIGEDGYASATSAEAMDLDQWLAEYSLDEVWRMGRMGGRA